MKKKISDYIRNKSYSVLLIPESVEKTAKTIKLSFVKMVLLIGIYSVLIAFAGYVFFSVTMGNIFYKETGLTKEDKASVEELHNKLNDLTRELEDLQRVNSNLKRAVELVDTSLMGIPEPVNRNKGPNRRGNNIFAIVKYLFSKIYTEKEDEVYFKHPVNAFISRGFNSGKGHLGIDYVVKSGTPVFSAGNGYILFADYTVKDGYMIIINHADDYATVYKHLSVLIKKGRERVVEGELIALSGNSGETTTGPHLHFEIMKQGKPVDPKKYFLRITTGEKDEDKK